MKIRLFLITLLSALSLTAMAQEPPTLLIKEPKGGNEMMKRLLSSTMVEAATQSDDYQPISEPQRISALLDTTRIGQIPAAKYILITEIVNMLDRYMVTAKIMDTETAMLIKTSNTMFDVSSGIKEIQQQCKALAKEIFSTEKK